MEKTLNIKAVKIGKQVWSLENLDVDHYRNGDIIPEVQDRKKWSKLTTGAWCYYENDSENGKEHGKLYNWYAVNDPRGLAPEGWHIPSKEEYKTLLSTVKDDGNSLKAVGVGEDTCFGTNESGFSALLSGYRYYSGDFNNLDYYTGYWSSTAYNDTYAYYLCLYYDSSYTYLYSSHKEDGLSIRVIKDKGKEL